METCSECGRPASVGKACLHCGTVCPAPKPSNEGDPALDEIEVWWARERINCLRLVFAGGSEMAEFGKHFDALLRIAKGKQKGEVS